LDVVELCFQPTLDLKQLPANLIFPQTDPGFGSSHRNIGLLATIQKWGMEVEWLISLFPGEVIME
jgi:hypothetical protein